MTDLELNALAHTLASTTPIGRLNHAEILATLAKMSELGVLTAPAATVAK